jgi:hypothetical protein
MVLEGERLLSRTLGLARQAENALTRIPDVHVLGPDLVAERPNTEFDPDPLVVDVHGLELTCYQPEATLHEQFWITVETSQRSQREAAGHDRRTAGGHAAGTDTL